MENTIRQIPVAYSCNSEYRQLISEMKKRSYRILHGLNHIEDDQKIIALIIDNVKKTVTQSNVTCMACWCSANDALPLNVREFRTSIHFLIDDPDPLLYSKMIRKKKEVSASIDLHDDNSDLLLSADQQYLGK